MIIDIETPRLLLRRWRETDFDAFAKINANKDVMRFFPDVYDKERTKQLYDIIQEEFQELEYGLYAVEEKSSGNFIGFIGFHWARFDVDFCPCVEIGWRLDKDYWNRGYATEGAKACLKHGFARLGFDRVYSFTAVENVPSQRVMQKIGMRVYKYFEHPEVPEENPLRPHVCYVIE